jgi:hypothetical protein
MLLLIWHWKSTTPLLLDSGEQAHLGNKAQFSFELSWLREEGFYDLVKREWNAEIKEPHQLMFGKIKSVTLDVSFEAGQKTKVEFIKKRRKNFY